MSEIAGRIGGPRQNDEDAGEEELRADARGARWLRRRLAGAVLALTTAVEGQYRASTITGYTIVSLDPLQFLVSIELDSQMEGWLASSGFFGLSILSWQQQLLADRFAGFAPLASGSFAGIDHFTADTGAPLLADSIAWAECRIVDSLETGDHRCFIGEAVRLGAGGEADGDPLIYFLNRYRRLR